MQWASWACAATNLGMDQAHNITRPAGRRLKCQDPQIVQKYNEHLTKELGVNQSLQQLKAVYQQGITQLTNRQLKTLETLDQKLTQAKTEAERQCRKLHTGKVPWTPSLTVAIYKLLHWQGIQKWLQHGKISREVLCKRAKQGAETHLQDNLQLLLEAVKKQLQQATQDYKMIKKTSNR